MVSCLGSLGFTGTSCYVLVNPELNDTLIRFYSDLRHFNYPHHGPMWIPGLCSRISSHMTYFQPVMLGAGHDIDEPDPLAPAPSPASH